VIFYSDPQFTIELEDLGDTWQLEGLVLGDGKNQLTMLMPDAPTGGVWMPTYWKPTVAEYEAWLKQSDDPVMKLYKDGSNKIVKAVVRKATRQVDQLVAWKCYARDNYTCVYCGDTGVPLTYDHYLAQAYGGQTTMENGRTSCRPCNKRKGHMTIGEWKLYAAQSGLNSGEQITE
jgi:HNH endonuclease